MRFGLRTILIVLALATPVLAGPMELQKQGLENRVEFWKKVYTQYGADDVIIHDRVHVNLIYDVAADSDADSRLKLVKSALGEIRFNLSTPENLSETARHISDEILANGLSLSESTLRTLQET